MKTNAALVDTDPLCVQVRLPVPTVASDVVSCAIAICYTQHEKYSLLDTRLCDVFPLSMIVTGYNSVYGLSK